MTLKSSDSSMCEQTTLHAKNARQTYADNTDISRAELDFTVRLASFFQPPNGDLLTNGRKEGMCFFGSLTNMKTLCFCLTCMLSVIVKATAAAQLGDGKRVRAERSGGPTPKAAHIPPLI